MKDIKDIINLNGLINYIGFANTPTYLYKHFKLDDSIANLSKEYSTDDLVKTFVNNINVEKKDLVNLAVLYSCLFALMLKPIDEIYDFMKAMQFAPLRWADKISYLFLSSITLDIEGQIDLKNDPSQYFSEHSGNTIVF